MVYSVAVQFSITWQWRTQVLLIPDTNLTLYNLYSNVHLRGEFWQKNWRKRSRVQISLTVWFIVTNCLWNCLLCQCATAPPQKKFTSRHCCKALQRVVCLAERISGSGLPSLQDIYLKCCKSRAAKIIKDSNHPCNRLFILFPSGKRFRSMMAKTERLREELLPSGHQAPKLELEL